MRVILFSTLALTFLTGSEVTSQCVASTPQQAVAPTIIDSDHDGLSDDLEQALLVQFAPKLMIARHDCSELPAEFTQNNPSPTVAAENSTIYGQVFPIAAAGKTKPVVEIHYYHLWKKDCGRMGHDLDTEHVSVRIEANKDDLATARWNAIEWYAAAHEDTVCDASQVTRAATLDAEHHGPVVWVSAGKHASFLSEQLCRRGCGGDLCEDMVPLAVSKIVNLGESQTPMNGSTWISSPRWPLATKMSRSDFAPVTTARLDRLPPSDIAWVNPAKRPEQAAIAAGGSTMNAVALGNEETDAAISVAEDSTGSALDKSYNSVKHSLAVSARSIGKFLRHDTSAKTPQ